jgi:alpha-L-fucosidase
MSGRTLLFAIAVAAGLHGQAKEPPLEGDERTKWFRDAKFGIFIHWGPYAVIGRHEWARHRFRIPQAEYDRYARAFNPTRFNADAWVELARNAGAKYIVITSKHHDGFSIYRSKASDYDMEITPYPGDPLKMLAEASARKGMRLGFYHSIMDWRHPDYEPKRPWEAGNSAEGGNLDRYIDFMKAQLRELLTGYGEVAVVWFDGEWEHSTGEMRSDEVYDFVRGLQPNTLINDRLYKREPGNKADFGTPEQFVPATGVSGKDGRPALWESCVTINNDSWGFNKYETEFKTQRDLIRMLVEVASKGGNLLLNVGPGPDGVIQDEFVTRLNAIGRWMAVNGAAIYGTTASPFARLPFFGRVTAKGSVIYLHVFGWPKDGALLVPGLKNIVHSAWLMAEPSSKLATRREGEDVIVSLPAAAPDDVASVVALQLDGTPSVTPYRVAPGEDGVLRLGVESCEIETDFGQRAKKENALGRVFLTQWNRAQDTPVWLARIGKAGTYKVEITYGTPRGAAGSEFSVEVGGERVAGKVQNTGGDWVFQSFAMGTLQLAAGEIELRVRSLAKAGTALMNLEKVALIRE